MNGLVWAVAVLAQGKVGCTRTLPSHAYTVPTLCLCLSILLKVYNITTQH